MQLDVAVLHDLWAFCAGDAVIGDAVDLHFDPLFETSLTRVDEMRVAIVSWEVFWKR